MNPSTTDRSSTGRAALRRLLHTDQRGAEQAGTRRESAAGEDGFTLTEVIVSIGLFTVVSFAVMMALVTLVKLTGVTQNRVAASNLARQEVEKLRGQNSTLSLLDAAASTVQLKGTTFTITPILNPSAASTCTPGGSRNVTVKVSWNDSSTRSVRYDTVLSC